MSLVLAAQRENWDDQRKSRNIRSFLKNLYRWNMHVRLLRTIVLRGKLQIALFFSFFPPTGLSPIQCNSIPVMTRKELGRLDKDLKTN